MTALRNWAKTPQAPWYRAVGENIKTKRRQTTVNGDGMPMTQAILCHAIGVSKMTLQNIEAGRFRPTAYLLERIAIALGCTVSELVSR